MNIEYQVPLYTRLHRKQGTDLDFPDDDKDPTIKMRRRIWQLESDVAALLLVDARRHLSDRRRGLLNSNASGASAYYAQEHAVSDSRPATSPNFQTGLDSSYEELSMNSFGLQNEQDDASAQNRRPVSRTHAARVASPTLTQRIRHVQLSRQQTGGYRKSTGKRPIDSGSCLPLLQAAVSCNLAVPHGSYVQFSQWLVRSLPTNTPAAQLEVRRGSHLWEARRQCSGRNSSEGKKALGWH